MFIKSLLPLSLPLPFASASASTSACASASAFASAYASAYAPLDRILKVFDLNGFSCFAGSVVGVGVGGGEGSRFFKT